MNEHETPVSRELLDGVLAIAASASTKVVEVYRAGFSVSMKADGSPLCGADLAAHDVIAAGLAALGPLPVLSEESGEDAYAGRHSWPEYWLVDPLDGTREFVDRSDEFTVNIALIRGDRPVLGVVVAPALDRTYFAAAGHGAFVRNGQTAPERIGGAPATGVLRVAVSRSHGGDALPEFLERLGPHTTVAMGSSLKLCLVAQGAADLYPRLGRTCEWDIAAADCVVREAGGRVCDAAGQTLRYNKDDLFNPWFFAATSETARTAALRAFAAGSHR